MTIADFVRQHRKRYQMTQRDLADRAGVGIRFIRELEAGKPTLRMDKVNVVLICLDISLALFQHGRRTKPCVGGCLSIRATGRPVDRG